jgi:hypothetical protein
MKHCSLLSLHIRESKKRLLPLVVVFVLVSVLALSESGFMQQSSALNILAGGTNSNPSTSSSLIAIDGSDFSHNTDNSSSLVTTISTAQSPDVIIVLGSVLTGTQVIPHVKDAARLTWIARTTSPIFNVAYHAELFEYYAIAATPLSVDSVNVSINLAQNFSVKVFGISGANTNSPFDPGLPAPAQRAGTTNPSVSVTTSNPNDMILGLAFVSGAPTISAGTGFSCIGTSCASHANNPVAFGEYQVVSSTQSGYAVSVTLSNKQSWIMVADAVVQAASSSSTSVICSPGSVVIGSPTTCTATVTGNNPTGTISWQSSGSGTFSATSCTLSSGSCSVNYTSSSNTSPVTITATYSGDNNNVAGSPGTYSLAVTLATSSTSVLCSTAAVGSSTTCTATVSGRSPTGTITFSSTDPSGKFSPSSSCTLSSASCSVTYAPSSTTTAATINASYAGDTNNSPSSGTFLFSLPPPTTTTATTTSHSTTTIPGPNPFLSNFTLIIAVIAIAVIAIGGTVIGVLIRRRYY